MKQKEAFIFPGQGTQFVGMGSDLWRDFPPARAVFEEVDDTLHRPLSHLMTNGDLAALTETQNAQPAIMAVSMAIIRILEHEGIAVKDRACCVAGHSLGEYTALCAAGSLTLQETARLLNERGKAMAAACLENAGQMLALLGATPEQATEIATASHMFVANDNAVGQVVLSGLKKNMDTAKEIAEKMGVRRVIPLTVAGAFHSPLMQSAAEKMKPLLEKTDFKKPSVPVFFNVLAKQETDPKLFADLLTRQIVCPVRWRETIQNMPADSFIECGPGNVLSGLMKRIRPQADVCNLSAADLVIKFLQEKNA